MGGTTVEAIFAGATAVTVREGGVADGRALGTRVCLELAGADVAALGRALALRSGPPFRCHCRGDYALEVRDGAGRVRAVVGLHHGVSIRVDAWSSDGWLADPEALLGLLAARGLEAPLASWRAARADAAAADARRARWDAAMPMGVPTLLPTLVGPLGLGRVRSDPAVGAAASRLAELHGGAVPAARALLGWLATSESSWFEYPAEETVPLDLLDRLGPEAVVAVLVEADGRPRDARLWCAAGRALVHGAWSRRTAREACAPVADALVAIVAREVGDAARRKVEHLVLPPPRAVVTGGPGGGREVVRLGLAEHQLPVALAVPPWAAVTAVIVDGPEVAAIDAGGRRSVLATIGVMAGDVAVDERAVLVTDFEGQRVLRITRGDGRVEVLADGEPRPLAPRLWEGRPIWTSCPFVQEEGGASSITAMRIRTWDASGGARSIAEWTRPSAWDACPFEDGIGLVVRRERRGGLWGLGRTRTVNQLRTVGWDGAVREGRVLADPAGDGPPVRLARAYRAWCWYRRSPGEVWHAHDGYRARRVARFSGDVLAMAADSRGPVVVVRDGETSYRIVDLPSSGQGPLDVACYEAPTWHRPLLAVSPAGVFFAVGHEVLLAPR